MKKYIPKIIAAVTGAVAGFLYYKFVGCASGSCPITGNPFISTLYGALLGYLLLGAFVGKKNETGKE